MTFATERETQGAALGLANFGKAGLEKMAKISHVMGSLSSHVKIAVKNTKQGNTKIQCDG